ncbi:glycosyltransferase family 2 protein [Natrarchaeobius sp. A-rgal3]|uniref:glycosyltransferase family 2 protein n=1 Tax=Natrarchaeobius versutus TaxID=1679078 RepID=UPI0035106A18
MEQNKPSVSVIIPAYNAADVIRRAINSVLLQKFQNFEAIIVDDASEDDTRNVVKTFADPRVRYIRHEKNRGASSARNTGIQRAEGTYIAFLDADDEWDPRKLEIQVAELESRSDEWVAVHCAREDENGTFGKLRDLLAPVIGTENRDATKEGREEVAGELLSLNIKTGSSTLLVRREAVEAIEGFDSGFRRHQDWEFLIRVLQYGKIAYIDRPLVVKHDSGSPDPEVFEQSKELLFSKFSKEITELESVGFEITATQRIHLAKVYIENGQIRKGFNRLPKNEIDIPTFMGLMWSLSAGIVHIVRAYWA